MMMWRNPNELGGLYFSLNAIMSQALLWGSIMLYSEKMRSEDENSNDDDGERVEQLTTETLVNIGQGISSVWVLSVSIFFATCNKEYVRTFVSTATAKEYGKQCWDW
jgi:hypothetical protein